MVGKGALRVGKRTGNRPLKMNKACVSMDKSDTAELQALSRLELPDIDPKRQLMLDKKQSPPKSRKKLKACKPEHPIDWESTAPPQTSGTPNSSSPKAITREKPIRHTRKRRAERKRAWLHSTFIWYQYKPMCLPCRVRLHSAFIPWWYYEPT
jgi:hypothetical protein